MICLHSKFKCVCWADVGMQNNTELSKEQIFLNIVWKKCHYTLYPVHILLCSDVSGCINNGSWQIIIVCTGILSMQSSQFPTDVHKYHTNHGKMLWCHSTEWDIKGMFWILLFEWVHFLDTVQRRKGFISMESTFDEDMEGCLQYFLNSIFLSHFVNLCMFLYICNKLAIININSLWFVYPDNLCNTSVNLNKNCLIFKVNCEENKSLCVFDFVVYSNIKF